jgi:two-component system, NtrC family, C4-dicarboxylate transport response regulator DctD
MKPRILIVDDCLDSRSMVLTILEIYNFDLDTADNASTALVKIQTNLPDAVITDYRMPDMDGYQFLCHIRAVNQQLPVLILSGVDKDYLTQLTANGEFQFSAFIQKPLDPDYLVQTVKQVLNLDEA